MAGRANAAPIPADLQETLRGVSALLEQTLQRLADTPCVSLLEQYARLQRLLGAPDQMAKGLQPVHQAIAQVRYVLVACYRRCYIQRLVGDTHRRAGDLGHRRVADVCGEPFIQASV